MNLPTHAPILPVYPSWWVRPMVKAALKHRLKRQHRGLKLGAAAPGLAFICLPIRAARTRRRALRPKSRRRGTYPWWWVTSQTCRQFRQHGKDRSSLFGMATHRRGCFNIRLRMWWKPWMAGECRRRRNQRPRNRFSKIRVKRLIGGPWLKGIQSRCRNRARTSQSNYSPWPMRWALMRHLRTCRLWSENICSCRDGMTVIATCWLSPFCTSTLTLRSWCKTVRMRKIRRGRARE